jgi:hypothetical protein
MNAFLTDTTVDADDTTYDLQYFLVDDDGHGNATCGIAFKTLMTLYRRLSGTMSKDIDQ